MKHAGGTTSSSGVKLPAPLCAHWRVRVQAHGMTFCCMVSLALRAAGGRAQLAKVAAALAESPRFLILDFRQAIKRGGKGGRHMAQSPRTSWHRLRFWSGCWVPPGEIVMSQPSAEPPPCLLCMASPAYHACPAMLCNTMPACRRVLGVDATAARSFVTLHSKLQRMGIQVIGVRVGGRLGWGSSLPTGAAGTHLKLGL